MRAFMLVRLALLMGGSYAFSPARHHARARPSSTARLLRAKPEADDMARASDYLVMHIELSSRHQNPFILASTRHHHQC